jgi:hypothetical protein
MKFVYQTELPSARAEFEMTLADCDVNDSYLNRVFDTIRIVMSRQKMLQQIEQCRQDIFVSEKEMINLQSSLDSRLSRHQRRAEEFAARNGHGEYIMPAPEAEKQQSEMEAMKRYMAVIETSKQRIEQLEALAKG